MAGETDFCINKNCVYEVIVDKNLGKISFKKDGKFCKSFDRNWIKTEVLYFCARLFYEGDEVTLDMNSKATAFIRPSIPAPAPSYTPTYSKTTYLPEKKPLRCCENFNFAGCLRQVLCCPCMCAHLTCRETYADTDDDREEIGIRYDDRKCCHCFPPGFGFFLLAVFMIGGMFFANFDF